MSFVDPYFDENIGDLRNLLGAKSSEELKELEAQIVFANELELETIGIPRTNDLTELLLIHKQLFSGISPKRNIYKTCRKKSLLNAWRTTTTNSTTSIHSAKVTAGRNVYFGTESHETRDTR